MHFLYVVRVTIALARLRHCVKCKSHIIASYATYTHTHKILEYIFMTLDYFILIVGLFLIGIILLSLFLSIYK